MSSHEQPIVMPVQNAGAHRMNRGKAVALEMAQTLSWTARDALFAYAMSDSAVASLACHRHAASGDAAALRLPRLGMRAAGFRC